MSSWIWWTLVATTALTATAYLPSGKDAFRIPKDGIFLVGSALAAALLACAVAAGKAHLVRRPSFLAWLCLAGVLWTGIASLASSNLMLSIRSFWWVVCCGVFLLLTWQLSINRSRSHALAVLVPALVNAAAVILQWVGAPIPVKGAPGLETIGLLGNPSDAGSYLAIAMAPALFVFGRSRLGFTLGSSGLLVLGIFLSRTVTAAVTIAVLGVVLLAFRWPRPAVLFAVLAMIGILVVVVANAGWIARANEFIAEGRLDDLLNFRVGIFLVSMHMISSSPLLGIGPGTFGFNYLPHATEVLQRQTIRFDFLGVNYGEAHNDHLEVFAETGAVGYAICLALAVMLIRRGWRARSEASGLMLISVVVTATTLALAQFPFQLAATTSAILFLIGLSLGDAKIR